MYYDYEGHAIATSTADAATGMPEHDQAQYFGYDCSCPRCNIDETPYYAASSLTEYELPRWYENEL